jgi:hypothetical protein
MTSLTVDTDHGVYEVLTAREADGAPDVATHAVFHESGALAGFVSDSGVAWDASGTPMPRPFGSLAAAAADVADGDPGWPDRIGDLEAAVLAGTATPAEAEEYRQVAGRHERRFADDVRERFGVGVAEVLPGTDAWRELFGA